MLPLSCIKHWFRNHLTKYKKLWDSAVHDRPKLVNLPAQKPTVFSKVLAKYCKIPENIEAIFFLPISHTPTAQMNIAPCV